MRPSEIQISGVTVMLEWREQGDSVGIATHSVDTDALQEGAASGPNDGQEFTCDGEDFFLGAHDYEDGDGGETTCWANIYPR